MWASETPGKGTAPHKLILQGDGNLVVYDANGVATWGSETDETRAIRLILQDDRNVVLYDGKGKALWSTETHSWEPWTAHTTHGEKVLERFSLLAWSTCF